MRRIKNTFSTLLKPSLFKAVFKNQVTEERTYFILTILTGVIAGLVAVALNKSVHLLTDFFNSDQPFTLRTTLLAGTSIFISGWITTRKFPSTAGSGIPGVRVALAVYHGKISIGSTIAKFFTTILSLSSGFSLGREGPTVAIASGFGSALGNYFHLSKNKVKALVAVGASGGIAAAFNTPISAVVFTLEEILGDLNAKMLGSIIISSVVASVTAILLTGDTHPFVELNYKLNSVSELIFYLFIGISAAIVGPLWVKSVLAVRKYNLRLLFGHRLTNIMLTFAIIAVISHLNPKVLGSGHHTIREALLSLILDWRVLLGIFSLKFLATSLSYGSNVSGGLFMPTLLMGATLGSLVGALGENLFPELVTNSGAFAIVGMGAYFAAVIRAPMTSVLIVFELTRDYNIILPLMIANGTAYLISLQIQKGSVYEMISEQDGIHLPSHEDNEVLETLHIEDAMVSDVFTLEANLTIQKASELIKDKKYSGFPVVRKGELIGMVSSNDILACVTKGDLDREIFVISERKVISVYPDQSLLVAFHKLRRFHVSRLPVVSRVNRKKILGIITAENIASKFGYHVTHEDDDENTDLKNNS
ncbi:MAG: CIC family chloride channel protein [Bacteriovoracaceae bacterium]